MRRTQSGNQQEPVSCFGRVVSVVRVDSGTRSALQSEESSTSCVQSEFDMARTPRGTRRGTLWFGPGSHGSMLRWVPWLGLSFGRSLAEGHRHSGNFGTREVQCRLLRSVDATVS